MQLNIFILTVFTLFMSQPSFAEKTDPPPFSFEKTQYVIEQLNLKEVGKTTFSVLFWDIYISKLHTATGRYPLATPNDSLLYEIEYLMAITRDDLIKKTVEQWQFLGVPESQYKVYLPKLKILWPDINEGDSLSLLIHNQRSLFYFNGHYLGEVIPPGFGDTFLAIWLSEETSQPELRRQLLRGNNNE